MRATRRATAARATAEDRWRTTSARPARPSGGSSASSASVHPLADGAHDGSYTEVAAPAIRAFIGTGRAPDVVVTPTTGPTPAPTDTMTPIVAPTPTPTPLRVPCRPTPSPPWPPSPGGLRERAASGPARRRRRLVERAAPGRRGRRRDLPHALSPVAGGGSPARGRARAASARRIAAGRYRLVTSGLRAGLHRVAVHALDAAGNRQNRRNAARCARRPRVSRARRAPLAGLGISQIASPAIRGDIFDLPKRLLRNTVSTRRRDSPPSARGRSARPGSRSPFVRTVGRSILSTSRRKQEAAGQVLDRRRARVGRTRKPPRLTIRAGGLLHAAPGT